MLLSRENIRPPVLPSLEREVPELGGAVIVRGMDMAQTMVFAAARRRYAEPRDGEDEGQAAYRSSGELLPLLLSFTVLAGDGLPVFSVAEWKAWGIQHPDAVRQLWDDALAMSGQQPEQEKKA